MKSRNIHSKKREAGIVLYKVFIISNCLPLRASPRALYPVLYLQMWRAKMKK
jgi:hypothetical protein